MEPTPMRSVHVVVDRTTGIRLVLHDEARAVSLAALRGGPFVTLRYPPSTGPEQS
jgi:hypothetical protein